MKCLFTLCLAFIATAAQAHFLFAIPGEKPGQYKIIFSDKLAPDDPELIMKIKQTKVWIHDAGQSHEDLKHAVNGPALVVQLPEKAKVLRFSCEYGVFQRGDNPAMLLNYAGAIAATGEVTSACTNCQPLQIEQNKNTFTVKFENGEVEGAEVVVIGPEGFAEQKLKTDKKGQIKLDLGTAPKGLYALRVKHDQAQDDEASSKKYAKVTNYFTLVLQHGEKTGSLPTVHQPLLAAVMTQEANLNSTAQLQAQIALLQNENATLKAKLKRVESLAAKLLEEISGPRFDPMADKTIQQLEEELVLKKVQLGPKHPTVRDLEDRLKTMKEMKK